MKKKIFQIKKSKSKKKLVCLTAYSKPIAKVLDKYCDMILVGDSIATAFYGMENTKKITLQTMINHSIAVKKGIKKSLLVVDMPINTYKNSIQAKKNAKKIFKNVRCDAVKIESNGKNFNIIKDLVKSGMPVMGHIGFTPQYKKKFKPFAEINNSFLNKKNFSFIKKINNDNFAKIIFFTSGTTGKPKGIQHKISTLLLSAIQFSKLSSYNNKDIVLHNDLLLLEISH